MHYLRIAIQTICSLLFVGYIYYWLTNEDMLWISGVVGCIFIAPYAGIGYIFYLGGMLFLSPFSDKQWYANWCIVYPLFILLGWLLTGMKCIDISCLNYSSQADGYLMTFQNYWLFSVIVSILLSIGLSKLPMLECVQSFFFRKSLLLFLINVAVLIISRFNMLQ